MTIPYGTNYPDEPWIDRDGTPLDGDPDIAFWSQRDILTHIHTFARSRSVSPYATLGCVLRRAISCVEPTVVLPPIVGGTVSVNLFTISAGRSGQGKDAANEAGFAAIRFPGDNGNDLDAERVNAGSGEGLARMFKGHTGDTETRTRVHQIVPEVKTLEALFSRKGATLDGELLKGYMGQPLGFQNAHKDTTSSVAAHSYRLCLGVGVQPENAGFFLSREKDGFPQRFLWLPTIDRHAPRKRPEPIAPVDVIIPHFGRDQNLIGVPQPIADEIVDHRYLVLIGDDKVDRLDGHLMLTRLKVAFGMALLEGRKDIEESDWKVAGELLDISKQVRDEMQHAIANKRRQENTARAYDRADQQAIVESRLDDKRQKRVADAITRKLERVGRATRRELRQCCTQAIRADFDPVFDLFIDEGFIVECDGSGDGRPVEYKLNRGD